MRQLAFPMIAAVSLAACGAAPGALAEESASPRLMTVGGEGEASAVPNVAILSVGVETEGASAAEALSRNAARMSATIAKLKARGVAEKDMQTRNLSVGARYDYSEDGKPPKIAGYTALNMLTVKLRKPDEAGSIIDDVIGGGANSLGGLSFEFDDPKPLMNEARKDAVADARAKAELYAKAAGVTLGPVLRIEDGFAAPPAPLAYMDARAALKRAESTPVAAGESTVTAHVTIVYEIK